MELFEQLLPLVFVSRFYIVILILQFVAEAVKTEIIHHRCLSLPTLKMDKQFESCTGFVLMPP